MHIGLISYTNTTSGIGIFAKEFIDYLGVNSILSAASHKGQEEWLGDMQVTASAPMTDATVERYFDQCRPDVVLYVETPFNLNLPRMAMKRGIKTAGIAMHESMAWHCAPLEADLIICPSFSAWEKATSRAKLLFLPIGLRMFPFRERTGHTFVQSIGYNRYNDRRQTAKIVEAFGRIKDPEARLVLNSIGEWPPGSVVDDERITYNQAVFEDPSDIYAEGDIALYPMAYEGYGRMISESMACGLPCLTVDGDPMNLFQHDPTFLCDTRPVYHFTGPACVDSTFYEVTVDELHRRMEWLLTIDTARYSRRARRQAEAQSWESKDIDYVGAWRKTLEDLVEGAHDVLHR